MDMARSSMLAVALAWLIATSTTASAGVGNWLGTGSDKAVDMSKPLVKTSKSPNMVSKMTTGTKRLVSNTKTALTPRKASSSKKTSKANTVQKPRQTSESKPGFFKSMLNPEPPPPPRTINEWMSLRQITPGDANR